MSEGEKRRAMILVCLVAVIVMIIAANLRQLEFQPGMPVPELVKGDVVAAPLHNEPVVVMHASEFAKMLLALTLLGAMLYVLARALRSCHWRDVWPYLRQAVIVCVVATGLPFLVMLLGKSKSSFVAELHIPPPPPVRTAPLGAVPPVLLWVVGTLLLAGALWLAWRIARPERPASTMDLIGEEAQRAWLALRSGQSLKAAIIQCYRQMSQLLAEEQGLEREEFMTTGEFETRLTEAGVPAAPIHQLTRLFEGVRYGKGQPDPADEQNAIQCLETIMSFCQTRRKDDGRE